MKLRLVLVVILPFLFVDTGEAGDHLSISLKGSYTTNTRFLYNVDRLDEFIDDKYFTLNFGYALDVRWLAYGDDILVGLNLEKIKTLEQTTSSVNNRNIPIEEGFVAYPVELTGYFIIPFSSEDVRVYLGGGIGWYLGERVFSVANVHAATLNSPSGFGIHVLTGADIRVYSQLAVRGELKFRDPQFDSVNKFEVSSASYNGINILLDQSKTTTRINLNGITYGLGLVFYL